jgi:hypothetical protein
MTRKKSAGAEVWLKIMTTTTIATKTNTARRVGDYLFSGKRTAEELLLDLQ